MEEDFASLSSGESQLAWKISIWNLRWNPKSAAISCAFRFTCLLRCISCYVVLERFYLIHSWLNVLKPQQFPIKHTIQSGIRLATSVARRKSKLIFNSHKDPHSWFVFRVVLLVCLPNKTREPSLLYYFTHSWREKEMCSFISQWY